MAKILQEGVDLSVGVTGAPWFWTTEIVCPSCGTHFQLTESDTLAGNVGPIGGNLWLGWRQVLEGSAISQPIDWSNLHIDPAQVFGPCPKCKYNPIIVRGPNYGLTKLTSIAAPSITDPVTYIRDGYNYTTFFRGIDSHIYAIILQEGTYAPYYTDASLNDVYSITRLDDGTIKTNAAYTIGAPGIKMEAEVVEQEDIVLFNFLRSVGFTII